MEITIDSKYNRAFFSLDSNRKKEIISLNATEVCNEYEVNLRSTLTEVYEPLEILMEITILNKIPQNGNEFCNDCVMFEPEKTAIARNKIAFITGCNGAHCEANLTLEGALVNVTNPYVMGSTKEIEIQYEISNTAENAYLTQLMISIQTNVTEFKTIPSNCKLSNMNSLMTCSILNGKPIIRNEKTSLLIKLDMSFIHGSTLKVNASVTCAGMNLNEANNSIDNILKLSEFSNIVMTSENLDSDLSIDQESETKEITYSYKINNDGPSSVEKLTIIIPVPTKYILLPNYDLTIMEFDSGSVSCQYANSTFEVLLPDHSIDNTKTFYTGDTTNQSVTIRSEKEPIYFNCSNTATTICTDVQININHFKRSNDPIEIKMVMTVNMGNIGECFLLLFICLFFKRYSLSSSLLKIHIATQNVIISITTQNLVAIVFIIYFNNLIPQILFSN